MFNMLPLYASSIYTQFAFHCCIRTLLQVQNTLSFQKYCTAGHRGQGIYIPKQSILPVPCDAYNTRQKDAITQQDTISR